MREAGREEKGGTREEGERTEHRKRGKGRGRTHGFGGRETGAEEGTTEGGRRRGDMEPRVENGYWMRLLLMLLS